MSRRISPRTLNAAVIAPFDIEGKSADEISCQQAFDQFLFFKKQQGCRPKTIQTYVCHVQEFVSWCMGDVRVSPELKTASFLFFPISSIRKMHIEVWEGVLRNERNNMDTSVQTKIKSIRTFLYWCMDEDRMWIKPFRINLPKADMTLKTPYTKEELDVLLAQPKTDDLTEWRTWAAISFIVRTGVRLSSAVNVKWCDIDLEKHVCILRHTKTNEQYYVPIPTDAMLDLMTWQSISPATNDGYVFFSTYAEKKINPNGLYHAIHNYNLSRGVEKTSVHLLRHTYATLYLQKGGRAERLQKILGHKTPEMTQRYVHFVTDDLIEGIDDFTI